MKKRFKSIQSQNFLDCGGLSVELLVKSPPCCWDPKKKGGGFLLIWPNLKKNRAFGAIFIHIFSEFSYIFHVFNIRNGYFSSCFNFFAPAAHFSPERVRLTNWNPFWNILYIVENAIAAWESNMIKSQRSNHSVNNVLCMCRGRDIRLWIKHDKASAQCKKRFVHV